MRENVNRNETHTFSVIKEGQTMKWETKRQKHKPYTKHYTENKILSIHEPHKNGSELL
jgi:hypothetical protein